MRYLYIAVISGVFIWLGLLPSEWVGPAPDRIIRVVEGAGVPNAVTGILLHFRLYDTIFEVFVFTAAVLGVQQYLTRDREAPEVYHISDDSIVILARIGAMIAGLVALELAIRGHLGPGGGFAAGVAGGTCIVLVAVTSEQVRLKKGHERWRAAVWEKSSVLIFMALTVPVLSGMEFPKGGFGALLSGGAIPWLNFLIAFKVAIGSWTILHLFIRYRGLL